MRKTVAVQQYYISIHALREEGDPAHVEHMGDSLNFYPRPPRGGRRRAADDTVGVHEISIHALREEGDKSASFSSLYQ